MPLSELIPILRSTYQEILSLYTTDHGHLAIEVLDEGFEGPFKIDPSTGEKIGEITPPHSVFEFARALHRSLFLGKPGRFIVGVISALLLLSCISGFALLVRRQGSLIGVFKTVISNGQASDYHTKISRWFLIPILIVSVTGTHLFLDRFELIPGFQSDLSESKPIEAGPILNIADFDAFKEVTLGDFNSLQFPFSEDIEDLYQLKSKRGEFLINQQTGEVVGEVKYPFREILKQLSFTLHTGAGKPWWSVVLLMTSIAILYLLYSGIKSYLSRKKIKILNPIPYEQCEQLVLVGSEHGGTMRYAKIVHEAFLAGDFKSHLTELNNFETSAAVKEIFILTSTYGAGQAPSNANEFIKKLEVHLSKASAEIKYSILGFGSSQYPDYCKFAADIDETLRRHSSTIALHDTQFVDNYNPDHLNQWVLHLEKTMGVKLELGATASDNGKEQASSFKILEKIDSPNPADKTFLLQLGLPKGLMSMQSGDLIGVFPPNENQERFYSIAIDSSQNTFYISCKLHDQGVCSNFLASLMSGDTIEGRIQTNRAFHLPKNSDQVILISNGTGIVPFLGMIGESQKNRRLHLYWGGKNQASLQLYEDIISTQLKSGKLHSFSSAFSQQGPQKEYIQDRIFKEPKRIIETIRDGGHIMICGSIAMQKDMYTTLDLILNEQLGKPLSFYQKQGCILVDCY